jgi:hypothetical protein
MEYHCFIGAVPGVTQSFWIIVDENARKWRTEPEGYKPPFAVECKSELDGTQRTFRLHPDGRAEEEI